MRILVSFFTILFTLFLFLSCSAPLKRTPDDIDNIKTSDRDATVDSDSTLVDENTEEESDEMDADLPESIDEIPDEDTVLQPMITNIKIEPNPNSVISCIVSWDTDIESDATVKFFADDTPIFIIEDKRIGNQHRVVVVGMKQDRTYTLSAISGATEEGAGTFKTAALPVHLLDHVPTLNKSEKTFKGWTLFTMNSGVFTGIGGTGSENPDFPVTILAYDMEGDIVWYSIQADMTIGDTRYYPKRGLISTTTMRLAQFKAESAYREVNWEGNTLFNNPQQPVITTAMDQRYHHTFERRPNGNLWSIIHHMENYQNGGNPIQQVLGDDIVEMDAEGNTIWSWNIFEHETLDLSGVPPTTVVHDWTHANYLFLNDDESILYLNTRHLSTLYKIEKATGNVLWRFGWDGDFTMTGDHPAPWFRFSHASKILKNGHILMYDNGNDLRNFSRAIEYEINEIDMTAKVVWEYGGPKSEMWQTLYWGDADRLPNGNTLICAGNFDKGTLSIIKEVTDAGEKVWEILFPLPDETTVYGIYNAIRIVPPVKITR